jgi:O-antigen/teichoic acid export membrane protein
VLPAIAGIRLGDYGLGLVNFAQNTAWFPLQLVTIVGRVSFPMFSRLPSNHQALAREVERAVLLCATATLFFVALCLGIGPKLVTIIYWDQWARAIPALYVYALAITFGFLSPVVAAVLEALGEPQIIFRLAAGWMLRAAFVAAVAAATFGRWALLPWLTSGLSLTAAVLCLALVFIAIAVCLDRSLLVAIRSLSSRPP